MRCPSARQRPARGGHSGERLLAARLRCGHCGLSSDVRPPLSRTTSSRRPSRGGLSSGRRPVSRWSPARGGFAGGRRPADCRQLARGRRMAARLRYARCCLSGDVRPLACGTLEADSLAGDVQPLAGARSRQPVLRATFGRTPKARLRGRLCRGRCPTADPLAAASQADDVRPIADGSLVATSPAGDGRPLACGPLAMVFPTGAVPPLAGGALAAATPANDVRSLAD